MINNITGECKIFLKNSGISLEITLTDEVMEDANHILVEVFRNYTTDAINYAF